MSSLENEFRSNLSTEIMSEIDIWVKARDSGTLRKLANNIINATNGVLKDLNETNLRAEIAVKKDSQADLAMKLAKNVNYCFYIKPSERGIIIEEFECPPCREGAVSPLPEKYFILKDGRVVEKRDEKTYLVYICKMKKN